MPSIGALEWRLEQGQWSLWRQRGVAWCRQLQTEALHRRDSSVNSRGTRQSNWRKAWDFRRREQRRHEIVPLKLVKKKSIHLWLTSSKRAKSAVPFSCSWLSSTRFLHRVTSKRLESLDRLVPKGSDSHLQFRWDSLKTNQRRRWKSNQTRQWPPGKFIKPTSCT